MTCFCIILVKPQPSTHTKFWVSIFCHSWDMYGVPKCKVVKQPHPIPPVIYFYIVFVMPPQQSICTQNVKSLASAIVEIWGGLKIQKLVTWHCPWPPRTVVPKHFRQRAKNNIWGSLWGHFGKFFKSHRNQLLCTLNSNLLMPQLMYKQCNLTQNDLH